MDRGQTIEPSEIDAHFAPSVASVAVEEIEGETLILDTSTGALHLLNPTATIVWGCLDGVATLAELADDLAEATATPRGQVEQEVVALVRDLGARGLLSGVRGGVPRQE